MGFKGWLLDALSKEVMPPSWLKYVIVTGGAVVGGYVFGLSGSWLEAIRWDLFACFCIWTILKISEPLGELIVRAALFLLP